MRKVRLFILLVFVLALFTSAVKVNAINTGFETKQLSVEEKNNFLSNMDLLRIDEEPEIRSSISCFDVNSNGLIAIGRFGVDEKKTVCVYSDEGVFQYGYKFDCRIFGVEWDEENLNICFGGIMVSLTPSGEILDVLDVPDTQENTSYWNNTIEATKRRVGDNEYIIRNDMGMLFEIFAPSYSQVVVIDATGSESIIYDAGHGNIIAMILSFVVFFAGGLGTIIVVVRKAVRQSEKNTCSPLKKE